jgi:hypothetical protein
MMSSLEVDTPAEILPRRMKDAEIIDLIERLRQMQEKANALASQQLELTLRIETAFKLARELHQNVLADQHDVGGEG